MGSDSIWQEIVQAKEAGIPVVVSMGDYAARCADLETPSFTMRLVVPHHYSPLGGGSISGGYYISAPADRIIAQPGTLTGSIGVLFGKLVLNQFFRHKLGITQESIKKVRQRGRRFSSPIQGSE